MCGNFGQRSFKWFAWDNMRANQNTVKVTRVISILLSITNSNKATV